MSSNLSQSPNNGTDSLSNTHNPDKLFNDLEHEFDTPEQFLDEAVERGFLPESTRRAYHRTEVDDVLASTTHRVSTGYGELEVILSEQSTGEVVDIQLHIGKSGGFTSSFTDALEAIIGLALESGCDILDIADELKNRHSPKVAFDNGELVPSIPAAVAIAIFRHSDIHSE